MQIEHNPRDSGPGSVLRERDVFGLRGFPGADDLFGSRLVSREPLHLSRYEFGQGIHLAFGRIARNRQTKREPQTINV